MRRKLPIHSGSTHHVYSKSICHFQIYNNPDEYQRFIELLRYYRYDKNPIPFSKLVRESKANNILYENTLAQTIQDKTPRVLIIAYCLMPTHFHLILHQIIDRGIERFIADICNSYTRYFNLRHNRRGPLWQNRFGNSKIETKIELLETSRYVHLNPTTSYLNNHPRDWMFSSFREYIGLNSTQPLCDKGILNIDPLTYEKFVVQHIETQRALKKQ